MNLKFAIVLANVMCVFSSDFSMWAEFSIFILLNEHGKCDELHRLSLELLLTHESSAVSYCCVCVCVCVCVWGGVDGEPCWQRGFSVEPIRGPNKSALTATAALRLSLCSSFRGGWGMQGNLLWVSLSEEFIQQLDVFFSADVHLERFLY